jgi:hypothetical protein
VVSSPSGETPLETQREISNLNKSIRELTRTGYVELDVLKDGKVTRAQLFDRLQNAQNQRAGYHVFHFIGHGRIDRSKATGELALVDEYGRADWIDADRLGVMLKDHPSIRLVVLNSCEGAGSLTEDPSAGIAQRLVQSGVPAVIAMQFEITDAAAIEFGNRFYASLSIGKPIDTAVADARKAIFLHGNDVEWGTPVLYLRSPDGQLFDMPVSVSRSPGEATSAPTAAEQPPKPRQKKHKRVRLPNAVRPLERHEPAETNQAEDSGPDQSILETHDTSQSEPVDVPAPAAPVTADNKPEGTGKAFDWLPSKETIEGIAGVATMLGLVVLAFTKGPDLLAALDVKTEPVVYAMAKAIREQISPSKLPIGRSRIHETFDSAPRNLPSVVRGTCRFEYTAGAYVIQNVDTLKSCAVRYPDYLPPNARIELSARILGRDQKSQFWIAIGPSAGGMSLRTLADTLGWQFSDLHHVAVWISADGTYFIGRWVSDRWVVLRTWRKPSAGLHDGLGLTNRLVLETSGKTLKLSAYDRFAGLHTLDSLVVDQDLSGQLVFAAGSQMSVSFDQLNVTGPNWRFLLPSQPNLQLPSSLPNAK